MPSSASGTRWSETSPTPAHEEDRARMHAGVARWIANRTAGAMGEDAEIVIHHIDAALELAPAANSIPNHYSGCLLKRSWPRGAP